MQDVYLGEIRLFSSQQPMRGWSPCDGSLINIREHQALYSLLGHRFGGDGVKTFALPDLRGRHIVGAPSEAAHRGRPVSGDYAITADPAAQTPEDKRPFLTLQYCIATTGDYPPRNI